MLACKVEQEHGQQQGNELEHQGKELWGKHQASRVLPAMVLPLSWASVDEGGERPCRSPAGQSALGAAASTQALDRYAETSQDLALIKQ